MMVYEGDDVLYECGCGEVIRAEVVELDCELAAVMDTEMFYEHKEHYKRPFRIYHNLEEKEP